MTWTSASADNPGSSTYYSDDESRPGHRYVIHHKREGAGIWRLLHRPNTTDALRTIYIGQTLKECKAYAVEYKALIGA